MNGVFVCKYASTEPTTSVGAATDAGGGAPLPELPTVILFSVGLIVLAGYVCCGSVFDNTLAKCLVRRRIARLILLAPTFFKKVRSSIIPAILLEEYHLHIYLR